MPGAYTVLLPGTTTVPGQNKSLLKFNLIKHFTHLVELNIYLYPMDEIGLFFNMLLFYVSK